MILGKSIDLLLAYFWKSLKLSSCQREVLEANKQGRKRPTAGSACLAMLRAISGAEKQAALAAMTIRHSRKACAGRHLGVTGKKNPVPFAPKCLLCHRSLHYLCQPGYPPWHVRTHRIPLPPLGCRHSSAPSTMGRTPTSPCPALGVASALPLRLVGHVCRVCVSGSAWGCILLMWAVWLCLMAHAWCEEGRKDQWKKTAGACNGADKEKNELDLMG